MLKLNETPVRTAKNFKINNVKLENIEIPQNVKEFENIEIEKENSVITYELTNKTLTFGLGDVLEENVLKKANHKIKIVTNVENENIKIVYNFDEDNLNLINEIEIVANGNANVVVKYESNTNKPCFHNGIIRLFAKENSKVDVTIVNLLNEQSNSFEAIENELEDSSKVNYTIIDLGGKNSVSNYYSNILGNNAKNFIKTIYLGSKNQLKDINYIAELKGIKAQVDIDVQGALQDNAKKNFKGTIDFKRGCKKAIGNEYEYCTILSEKAKSISLPMLLCTEEDIEGNHGVASGKVAKEELFYIMSRGLSYKEAIKLIVKAKFNKIIENIKNKELQEEIEKEIDRRLD